MISEEHRETTYGVNVEASSAAYPQDANRSSNLRWWLTGLLILVAVGIVGTDALNAPQARFFVAERFQTFVTIFLGIFIEAAPFLLAGSLVSGFIAIFVNQDMLEQYLPKQPVLAALSGSLLGLVFPVCECGVVPVTRRLYEKGLPLSIGIAFLLSAPVINIIVFISTYAAFGWGAVLYGRIAFTILIAFTIGLVFHFSKASEILLPSVSYRHAHAAVDSPGLDLRGLDVPGLDVPGLDVPGSVAQTNQGTLPETIRGDEGNAPYIATSVAAPGAGNEALPDRKRSVWPEVARALNTAGDDFIDMGRYLIVGSMLAATMQTLVPQSALLAVGQGSVLSVLVMQALAFVLSVCSTVDAFLALAFTGTFTTGSILAFLTFGPMVDIKSALMFLGVFQRRVVFYLIAVPFVMSLFIGLVWNIFVGA